MTHTGPFLQITTFLFLFHFPNNCSRAIWWNDSFALESDDDYIGEVYGGGGVLGGHLHLPRAQDQSLTSKR